VKLTVDSREEAKYGYYFHTLPENLSYELRQIKHYVGVWFSPENSPTTAQAEGQIDQV
jgi:hypothetical protein